MQIPSLPTDNLYKFAALSGTIIFLLSFYLPFSELNKMKAQTNLVGKELSIAEVEIKYLEKKSNKLSKLIENTLAANNHALDSTGKVHIYYTDSEVKAMIIEIDDLQLNLSKKNAEIRIWHEQARQYQKDHKYLRVLWIFLMIIGLLLAIQGYYLWYFKIQQYEDIIIKNNAAKESPNRSLNSDKTAPSS